MSIFPVISRELRAQARQPLTYWLRVVGAAAILIALINALWTHGHFRDSGILVPNNGATGAFGMALFGILQPTIFFVIWITVPLSMADMISRERREGTLSLLYLTKLDSLGIVLGKAFVHVARSFSLFLTMIPWLMLPLLFGGVGLYDVSLGLMLCFASFLFATAAGVLASTISRDWLLSVILAEAFALILLLFMLQVHGRVLRATMLTGVTPGAAGGWAGGVYNPLDHLYYQFENHLGFVSSTSLLLQYTANYNITYWDGMTTTPTLVVQPSWQGIASRLKPQGKQVWRKGVVGIVGAATLTLLAAIAFASWYLQRTWRDRIPSRRFLELKQRFLTPRYGVSSLRSSLASSLSSNPIGWLQLYSPSARLVKWGWCLFVIVVQVLFSGNYSDLYSVQGMLGVLLLLGLAFSATGSFRSELETGAFELLLVTPIREGQIIMGRLRGLWKQFLPAIVVYVAGNLFLASGWQGDSPLQRTQEALTLMVLAFCTLPVVGLFFSIKRLNFFVAWGLACVLGLAPTILGPVFGLPHLITILVQFGIALTTGFLLFGRLRSHSFRAAL